MVPAAIPGELWEVEFFEGREPEVEVFNSDGSMFGSEKVTDLDKARDQRPLSTRSGRLAACTNSTRTIAARCYAEAICVSASSPRSARMKLAQRLAM